MYVVFNVDSGWSLRDQVNIEGDYALALARQRTYQPFPNEMFADLTIRIVPLRGTECTTWSGIVHRFKVPYYYNRYAPGYAHQMPARQLLLAQHLNLDPIGFPRRLKVGMICTGHLCVTIAHMIPYNFYARTKLGDIATPVDTITPEKQAELDAAAETMKRQYESRSIEPKKIYTPDEILQQAFQGRQAKLPDNYEPPQPKTAEPEQTTLDEIFPTKPTQG